MKKNIQIIFTLMLAIFFVACNNTDTRDNKIDKTDSTFSVENKETSTMPPYDAAMDPLTVEAAYAKVLADTLKIKMYEITLKPGDSAAIHTHPDYTFYVLQGGKIAITSEGKRQEMDVKAGMGMIFGSLTHTGKNIGTTTIKLLISDIYPPRGK